MDADSYGLCKFTIDALINVGLHRYSTLSVFRI